MVLRNKCKPDGSIDRRKARVVARGFAQQPGVHFNETFEPVALLSSIRLLIALAAKYKMEIKQLDVTTAYLNGPIKEEVFMEVPEYFAEALEVVIKTERIDDGTRSKAKSMLESLKKNDVVCLLQKSIYGLRQAGRNWYEKLDAILKEFCRNSVGREEDALFIIVYVDILLISKNSNKIDNLKEYLSSDLEIKNLGEPKYCLGIEFSRSSDCIVLQQTGYIHDLLIRFGMKDSKPVSTSMDVNVKLIKPDQMSEEEDDCVPYRELVSALMYLAVATSYLKGSAKLGLTFKTDRESLKGFVDADWANCLVDRRSYTGYTFILGGSVISWDSKKQRTVALSSTEAKYMGLTEAAKEIIHIKGFLSELGFENLSDAKLFNDNMGAQRLAENPSFHARSKHIDVRHHFIREMLRKKLLRLEYVPTEDMMANMMTKPLPGPKHQHCLKEVGLGVSG